MSVMKLLILGLMYKKEPMHGYEIRQTLESWNAELWTNIAYGSIYFALKQLAKEHLLEPVTHKNPESAVARIVYAITPAGQKEFLNLLRKQWWEIKPAIDPFQVALTFMNYMPQDELLLALEYRINQLKSFIKSIELLAPLRLKESEGPAHIIENFNLLAAQMKSASQWMEEFEKKIQNNELPYLQNESKT